ncbi:hypothetical protein [Kaarinaea lacus]
MFKYLNFAVSITLLALQVGCSGAGSSEPPAGGGGNVSCNGAVTELEGGWAYCDVFTGNYTSYSFENNCVTLTLREYSNNDCTGIITFDESATYTFTTGSNVLTDGGQVAREIDVGLSGATQYDIYLLSSNILYRGLPTATNNMSSPLLRPTSLNFSIPYTSIP